MSQKYYVGGIIVFLLVVVGCVFIYKQTHTIETTPYHQPTTQVPPDPGGPRATVNSTTDISPSAGASASVTNSTTTNTTTNTSLSPTPEVNQSAQSNEISPTISISR